MLPQEEFHRAAGVVRYAQPEKVMLYAQKWKKQLYKELYHTHNQVIRIAQRGITLYAQLGRRGYTSRNYAIRTTRKSYGRQIRITKISN